MTSVIKHELRASASAFGSYHPEGWHPKLSVTLVGPLAPGGELVWVVARPGGAPWFEHRVPAPVLDDRQTATVDLELWRDGLDLDEAGVVPFTLRLVSEIDGVDELLHDGRMLVAAMLGEHRYAVDNDGMLERCLIGLDTADDSDAPRLAARVFVVAEVEAWQLEAHCFREGVRFAQASTVEGVHSFTANDGQVVGQTIGITFDGVRGWNNLSASGWGDGWHLLDQNDGSYRVKVVQGAAVIAEAAFEVRHGRIVAPGAVEPDTVWGAAIVVPGPDDSRSGSPADSYGDPLTAAATTTVEEIYALRRLTEPAPGGSAGSALDDAATAGLQAFVDRAERLLTTWESELAAPPPYDFGRVLAAEAVLRERAGCEELASAAADVPGGHPVLLAGEPISLHEVRARTAALFPAAEALIAASQQSEADELAPYRALLSGDRLAIFDDHPADSFIYTTTDRRIIETPEELASAEYWFFEGPMEIPSSARVEGVEITGNVQGWRVLGWQFDAAGRVLTEFESQGLGSSAPKTAFRPPA